MFCLAAVTSPPVDTERRGLAQRLWTALRRFILGRSSWDYIKQFTGSDTYWDHALAAERSGPKPTNGKAASDAPAISGKEKFHDSHCAAPPCRHCAAIGPGVKDVHDQDASRGHM